MKQKQEKKETLKQNKKWVTLWGWNTNWRLLLMIVVAHDVVYETEK